MGNLGDGLLPHDEFATSVDGYTGTSSSSSSGHPDSIGNTTVYTKGLHDVTGKATTATSGSTGRHQGLLEGGTPVPSVRESTATTADSGGGIGAAGPPRPGSLRLPVGGAGRGGRRTGIGGGGGPHRHPVAPQAGGGQAVGRGIGLGVPGVEYGGGTRRVILRLGRGTTVVARVCLVVRPVLLSKEARLKEDG